MTCQAWTSPRAAELQQSLALGHREPRLLDHPQLVAAVVEEDVVQEGAEAGGALALVRADLLPGGLSQCFRIALAFILSIVAYDATFSEGQYLFE